MEERKFWIIVVVTLAAGFLIDLRYTLWPFDFATSVIPGWHTTIYSPWGVLRKVLLLICIAAAILIYRNRRNKLKS